MSTQHVPRRKGNSGKHKRQKLLDKRALKRGEITIEEHSEGLNKLNAQYGRVKPNKTLQSKSGGINPNSSSVRLKSKFVGLNDEYLQETRNLSFELILQRPLSPDSSIFPLDLLTERDKAGKLSCPSRPKFKVGQSTKEVEKNEEGHFKKWLKQTDDIMQEWVDGQDEEDINDIEANGEGYIEEKQKQVKLPRGPTWYETNLEVWRQLWRVTESSSILLLLLDSRCPLLHCPPSLRSYLQNLKPHKEIILVLTKSDLVNPDALQGWRDWVRGWWGEEGVQVVSVRSYDVELLDNGKGKHKPDIPKDSLEDLIIALKTAHEQLLEPPSWAKANEEKLKEWKPAVRSTIDWSSLAEEEYPYDIAASQSASTPQTPISDVQKSGEESSGTDQPAEEKPSAEDIIHDPSKEPLTVGLIGQPNVGKSSLLNALLGEQRVKASRTPGKIKHFQTMFWGPKKEIRFVDCPGLVCPSLVGLEIQALAATIPISQIASLPACITFCAQHLPLEKIFRIPYTVADGDIDPYAGKRTYRDPKLAEAEKLRREEEEKKEKWTPGKIMEGRAHDRGYLSAKSGRPDINRAANGIMRLLADGKIRWGFNPPGMKGTDGKGIWLESDTSTTIYEDEKINEVDQADQDQVLNTASEGESDFDSEEISEEEEEEEEEEDEEDVEGKEREPNPAKSQQIVNKVGGFFGALGISDTEDTEDESADDSEEEEAQKDGK
ncbi:uncharacterized protein L201_007205 [Kwoniella dendrophila CBS 6074]|uniref:Guanine nucleotide-binding protein-like 1 n=1 Tax=Kwoniella dendrophila CBS 6074 TaxID=1295534 RepID=A0AAX4K3C6_9TREE